MQNVAEIETCHAAGIIEWKPCFGEMTEPMNINMVVQIYHPSNLSRGEVRIWHH